MNYKGKHIPNSFFDYVGLPEEEVLKILPVLSKSCLRIIEKRFGYDLKSGDTAKLENKLTKMESDYLSKVIVPKILNNCSYDPEIEDPIIIEHREEVDSVLNSKKEYHNFIKEHFPNYDIYEINRIIISLMTKEGINYTDGIETIWQFTKDNLELIAQNIEDLNVAKSEVKEVDAPNNYEQDILWEILRNIRDNSWKTCSLEDLIKATKIAMLKSNFNKYNNFIDVLEFLLNHRFNVFRVLKSGVIENSNVLITTQLNYSKDNGDISIQELIDRYYELVNTNSSIENTCNLLSQEFGISKNLVMELLFNQDKSLDFSVDNSRCAR